MKGSDWKKFKQIKEKAIDRFCSEALREFDDVINDVSLNAHSRYLNLYRLVENKDKEMAFIFDGHSRSMAAIQLMTMRRRNLADENLLEQLSNDFRESTDPKRLE